MAMRTSNSSFSRIGICLVVVLCAVLAASPAVADYVSGFEDLDAEPDGRVLTGQDGYYLPPGTTSADFYVYTYTDNVLGVPQNPNGDAQFIGAAVAGGTAVRAQRDISFEENDTWLLTYDFAALYLGQGPSTTAIGSFSLQTDASVGWHYIHLMTWVDPANPTNFNAFYMHYDADGVVNSAPGSSPGPMWEGLEIGHWYRAWTLLDFNANQIIEVGIADLENGGQDVFTPTDWYMVGGSNFFLFPWSLRFFAGGADGNTMAFDNIAVEAGPVATESTTWSQVKSLYR